MNGEFCNKDNFKNEKSKLSLSKTGLFVKKF